MPTTVVLAVTLNLVHTYVLRVNSYSVAGRIFATVGRGFHYLDGDAYVKPIPFCGLVGLPSSGRNFNIPK